MPSSFNIETLSKIFILVALFTFGACNQKKEDTLFKLLSPSHTNINFNNQIQETEDFNILNFHYIYNGGGVGVADFNKDNLPDLVFSGNQVPSKIYLNQGNLAFKDITKSSNFDCTGWATGISIVDINADGWQDIYLSVGGVNCQDDCYNKLFIHQGLDKKGLPTFVESAAKYNLNDGQYTQQAAFLDYDQDGDLDVYLLHNVIDKRDKNAPSSQKHINEKSTDQLLRNDGSTFTDVSKELGIQYRGYGLGIAIEDFNQDGWADIYIANDFLSSDLVYLNKGKKDSSHLGFEEVGKTMLKHQSYNSMGVDVADINQDALPDIYVVDMMPEYHERQKTMLGFMNYNKFQMALKQDYAPQFIRNTLQVHNGFLQDSLLPFSDLGYLAGVYNTDWSWTPLLADFDNDGDRDIFVTNGYGKDITDLDFINYSNQTNAFGSAASVQKHLFETIQKMEEVRMPNFIFENEGKMNFQNQTGNWIPKKASISNGAVYADLDQDGDLDLVVNNIDEPAYVLENQTNQKQKNNYLRCILTGNADNSNGFNSQIFLYQNRQRQYHYHSPVRGYLSSIENIAHFGLGQNSKIDSLKIVWYDGKSQTLMELAPNQTLALSYENAKANPPQSKQYKKTIFQEKEPICEAHRDNTYYDFDAQRLLLHQHSRQGPCIVTANIDSKVGDEIFIGGAKGQNSKIGFPQGDSYTWQVFDDTKQEAVGAAFFDFESDGDLDLYIVYGGSEFYKQETLFQDHLYLNDGNGEFQNRTDLLPKITSSGSCVAAADYDQDGDIDLFVGGRVVPRKYPNSPQSHLLVNHNNRFIEMTDKLAPNLHDVGMICDATWTDMDGDGWQDLAIVGEWMPFTIFKNVKGGWLKRILESELQNTKGLWNCLATADLDQDGDVDVVLGNLGRNSRLQASADEPLTLYNKDFDKNGSPDPLVGQFYKNKSGERYCYPLHSRDDVVSQITKVKAQYVKYAEFGNATFEQVLQTNIGADDQLLANELRTVWLENKNGNFKLHALPMEAQTAPIQDLLIADFNKDKNLDILLVGNDYTAEKNSGWYDAQNGTFLQGDGKGNFKAIPTDQSGFYVPGDARSLVQFKDTKQKNKLLVGQNEDAFKVFDYE